MLLTLPLKKEGKSRSLLYRWGMLLSLPSLFGRLGKWLGGRLAWSL